MMPEDDNVMEILFQQKRPWLYMHPRPYLSDDDLETVIKSDLKSYDHPFGALRLKAMISDEYDDFLLMETTKTGMNGLYLPKSYRIYYELQTLIKDVFHTEIYNKLPDDWHSTWGKVRDAVTICILTVHSERYDTARSLIAHDWTYCSSDADTEADSTPELKPISPQSRKIDERDIIEHKSRYDFNVL